MDDTPGEYTTSLQIRFYDQAERFYVEQGLSPQAIHLKFVDDLQEEGHSETEAKEIAPSRRTIYNWKQEGDWESERRMWLRETEDIEAGLQEAIRAATKNAIENPNRDTFSALRNAISGAKMYKKMQGIEQGLEDAEEERDEGEVARDALEVVKQALEGG